jgi:hypothetical protein
MMKIFLYFALFFLLLSPLLAQEVNVSESIEGDVFPSKSMSLAGGLRASVFLFGQEYDYAFVFNEFQLKSEFQYQNAYFLSDIRLRSGFQFDESFTEIEVKEMYAGYRNNKFRLTAGNQIVVWGRTDGFNAVNYLAPVNYFFLSSNPDDQMLSNFMVRIRYQLNKHVDLDLVGIPKYKPSVYRYDLFKLNEYVVFGENLLPAGKIENSSIAGRLNFEISAAGFSLLYFQGYDPFHGFDLQEFDLTASIPVILNCPRPYFKRSIGADFEIPISSTILRGEFSYNHTSDYKDNMHVPNPDLTYVAAVEKDISGVTAVFQVVGKYTLDYSKQKLPDLSLYDLNNPVSFMKYAEDYAIYEMTVFNSKIFYQENEMNHALMLILAKSFMYETFNTEFTTYYNLTTEEFLIRPKLVWKTNDHLNLCVGGVYMHGPKNTLFDYSAKILSGLFVEMSVTF